MPHAYTATFQRGLKSLDRDGTVSAMNPAADYTFLEFFAGGGMAREGLGDGWKCLFANDADERKGAAYAAAWGAEGVPPPELIVRDVGRLGLTDLPAERADLAWASFPCQDLSLAGLGAGLAGERSGTFMPFYMLMAKLREREIAPRTIVLENVCGLLTSHGGNDFADICAMLGKLKYRFGAVVMDAVRFLPQSRPRLFIIAVDRELGVETTSGPTENWHPPRLRQAYSQLREDLRSDWLWLDLPVPPKRNVRLADLIEGAPRDVEWHSVGETQKLLSMMNDVNRAKVEHARSCSGREVGTIYKRTRTEKGLRVQRAEVRFDNVAGCLRTPGGGSSRQTIMVIEEGSIRTRLISARETARLMGLPEHYPLPSRYNDAYHLTGDGVAVPVVRHIAEWILEPTLRKTHEQALAA